MQDKIKEKLEKLRVDGESATARAETAEASVKALEADVTEKENTIQQLNNRVSLLQMDLERQEKRVEEVRVRYPPRPCQRTHTHIHMHMPTPAHNFFFPIDAFLRSRSAQTPVTQTRSNWKH